MPRATETVSKAFRARARSLDRYLKRVEALHSKGNFPVKEMKYTYAGAFVTFYTDTESAIEELFLGLLMGRISPPRKSIKTLVSIDAEAIAKLVIRGERSFADWLPYERTTKKRAKAFFARGEPFSSLDPGHRKALKRATVIRNALAHRSRSAQRRFRETFVAGKNLPQAERDPTAYLRGFHAPGQRRINLHFAEVVMALDDLCR